MTRRPSSLAQAREAYGHGRRTCPPVPHGPVRDACNGMRKRFTQIVRNEETVYAESEDLRNYFGDFCANQSSLHGETIFAGVRSQLVVKDSAFGRSIMVWPTPGSPSHQKHGTLLNFHSLGDCVLYPNLPFSCCVCKKVSQ
jgi:hypothetical protein